MRPRHFILDERDEPKPEPDFIAYALWREAHSERLRIARDEIPREGEPDGKIIISTVFLGLDHAWSGPPLLFETMVFGGELDEFQERYTSKPDALAGHARAVARVLQALALRKP